MKSFSFQMATHIEFGEGSLSKTGELTAPWGKHVLLVYGKGSIHKNGVYEAVTSSLREAGVTWSEHSGVSPNPVVTHAFEGGKKAREEQVDAILAVGGGSVIDEAKAIALGAFVDSVDELWGFYTNTHKVEKSLPIIAVQTMPATSSEVNTASVITNPHTREKFGARSAGLAPKAAILDPSVTLDIPKLQTAYGCIDIISHLIEGFFTYTDPFSPLQEGFALALSRAVKLSMDRIEQNPADIEARSTIMWDATLAWSGLGVAGWEGARIPCHTLEHPLSGVYDLPHGAGLSIVIPAYLTYYQDRLADRIQRFGKEVLGLEENPSASEVIEELKQWYRRIGSPASLSDWKEVEEFDLAELTRQSEALDNLWNNSGFQSGDIAAIYELMR